MSEAIEITQLETNLSNSYLSVRKKNGLLPINTNFNSLPEAIDSIPLKLFNANYWIDTSGIVHNIVDTDSNTVKTNESYMLFDINQKYYQDETVSYVNLSNIIVIFKNQATAAFREASNLKYLDLSSLRSVEQNGLQYAFRQTGLIKADLSSLKIVGTTGCNACFMSCRSLEDLNISSLEEINGERGLNAFLNGCRALKVLRFTSLNKIQASYCLQLCLGTCVALEDVYFNSLNTSSFGTTYTNQFNNMMQNTGTSVVHTLHFPSNMQSTISSLTGYPNFGGTSGYVTLAFDLPATS